MPVALVTGGGRGLGRAVADGLLLDGWQVAVTGRSPDALREVGADLALPGDASDREVVVAAVAETTSRLGPIDLLVANVGAFEVGGPLWESDPDDWWRELEVNLRSVQLALWAALPAMVARGSGRVVALGSGFGNRACSHGTAYGVGKTAVHRLVESVAAELAGTGVSAFAVGPGRARTDMTLGFPAGFTAAHPDYLDPPAGGWAPPEALVGLVRRLAAGGCDRLSGRYLDIRTDLDAALAAADDPDAGTLRLHAW
ncbi:MAG: short-chain dehydrogenase/reductase [Frankiales bacterium]|nr:short-chain dehydrogenase/reductase [Frankiales bacterium]